MSARHSILIFIRQFIPFRRFLQFHRSDVKNMSWTTVWWDAVPQSSLLSGKKTNDPKFNRWFCITMGCGIGYLKFRARLANGWRSWHWTARQLELWRTWRVFIRMQQESKSKSPSVLMMEFTRFWAILETQMPMMSSVWITHGFHGLVNIFLHPWVS